jgi:NADH-quinone oxidoreductase subunit C
MTELSEKVVQHFGEKILSYKVACDELTIEVPAEQIKTICLELREHPHFQFSELIDICGVDYSEYGVAEWNTEGTTFTGYSRAVDRSHEENPQKWTKPRFGVVYHLLSIKKNQRIRVRAFVEEEKPIIDSVIDIWECANWFEREAFDLFGILFNGHPDLRRLLTDYGFIGHPFRKDFPLIGQVEMRYDKTLQRCVYEPVSIQPRTLVPKTIRHDNRYRHPEEQGEK